MASRARLFRFVWDRGHEFSLGIQDHRNTARKRQKTSPGGTEVSRQRALCVGPEWIVEMLFRPKRCVDFRPIVRDAKYLRPTLGKRVTLVAEPATLTCSAAGLRLGVKPQHRPMAEDGLSGHGLTCMVQHPGKGLGVGRCRCSCDFFWLRTTAGHRSDAADNHRELLKMGRHVMIEVQALGFHTMREWGTNGDPRCHSFHNTRHHGQISITVDDFLHRLC